MCRGLGPKQHDEISEIDCSTHVLDGAFMLGMHHVLDDKTDTLYNKYI